MLLFLSIYIKNYRMQDAKTYSEVDSKCEIDSFSKLQLRGEVPSGRSTFGVVM